MKYKERDDLVKGLRGLADFIEARGLEMPMRYPSIRLAEYLWGDEEVQKAKLRKAALVLGKADKHFYGESLSVRKDFSESVRLEVVGNRSAVCVRRVVGTKEVPAYTVEARTEDIVEWDCIDPLLRAS